MTELAYVQGRLKALRSGKRLSAPLERAGLIREIIKRLLSRKFRKYAVSAELAAHIESAVKRQVEASSPINLTFLNGGYKLWRLAESPEVDWAEFFTVLHYTDWVKEICAIYEPGVWFDFFEDDLIVPRLNGMPAGEVDAYLESFQEMLDFLRAYQPANLRMTLTRVGDQFASPAAFHHEVDENLRQLSAKLPDGPPKLSAQNRAMIDLNARPELRNEGDPKWREQLYLLHDAYSIAKRGTGYHFRPDKILVFVQPLPSGVVLAVGTVRSSIAKFWIGVGALRRDGAGNLFPVVLTPSQLEACRYKWEALELEGLEGKNFHRIRVLPA